MKNEVRTDHASSEWPQSLNRLPGIVKVQVGESKAVVIAVMSEISPWLASIR